ncbi:hypothetical protein GUJ93_ZPchr0003g17611 [Zizania palustris]|uniref:Dirigent protein n=1 Tax=Zizania palustris TaxID=103762 RepID=A0A8J5VY60_ZIZPA|nr:hypothetical protein GUJ93_ZPchr0003g17611 [Zizania palustris]
MALNKNMANTCTCALLLLALLSSQLWASQGRPLPDDGSFVVSASMQTRRYLLSHGGNGAAVPNAGMVEGDVSPSSEIQGGDKSAMIVVDDVRPTTPGHSPAIGH